MRALRSVLGLLLLSVGGALAVVFTVAAPASACSCVGGGDAAHAQRSAVVFAGEVVDRSRGDRQIAYEFTVDRVFKGDTTPTTEVWTADQSSACGLTDLENGVTYLVYASGGDTGLATSSCSGTRTVSGADLDRVEALVGAARAPVGDAGATEATPATAGTSASQAATDLADRGAALGLVGGAAVVVIAGGLLLGRRRSS